MLWSQRRKIIRKNYHLKRKLIRSKKSYRTKQNFIRTMSYDTVMTINDEPKSPEKTAGYLSSIFNITNTIIGGGILALPFALKQAGLVLGILFIIVQALLVVYSSYLLTKASKAIDPIGGRYIIFFFLFKINKYLIFDNDSKFI